MKKEYLKYCNYYKGEEEPPKDFDWQEQSFWWCEKYYFDSTYEDMTEEEKKKIVKFAEREPKAKEFIKTLPDIIKPMIASFLVELSNHSPVGGCDYVLNYKPYENGHT